MSTRQTHAVADTLVPPPPATGLRFAGADTMRAVGALAVLTTHVAFWSGNYTGNATLGSLLARLDVGVAIFFVLSGFLLGRAWVVRAADRGPAPGTGPYLWHRLLRIVPLYVLTVVIALAAIRSNAGLGVRDWVVTLLMANTFLDPALPAGLTHMWSLAVEVTFYAVLPVIMLALVGRSRGLSPRRYVVGLAVMVAVSTLWILALAPWLDHRASGAPEQWLPAYLSWFAGGLLLALVQVLHERGSTAAPVAGLVTLARHPGSCWTLAVGLMLLASTPIAGPTMLTAPSPAEALTKHLLYAGVGFLLVLTAVFAEPRGWYGRAVGHPVGRRLGWISYGIFCLHLPLLHLIMWVTGWPLFQGRGLAIWGLALVLSVLAAEAAYRLVERPALALKNRPPALLRGRSEAAATSDADSGSTIR